MYEKTQTHPQVALSGCCFVIFFASVLFCFSSLDSSQEFYIKTGTSLV